MKNLFLILFLLGCVRLSALTPVPFKESVSVSTLISGDIRSTLTINAEGTTTVVNDTGSTSPESPVFLSRLRPGKSYEANVTGDYITSGGYEISFTAPQGYDVYINNLPSDLFKSAYTGTGSYSDDFSIEIRAQRTAAGGPWGSFSGISLGKSITWSVGLGDLRTGRSAGSIVFKEADLSNSPTSRSKLYYTVPDNLGQVFVLGDGPGYQTLRQICTPIGFTDLVDVSGGYEIRFYTWAQVSWSGSLYLFSGAPWKTIKVESPGAHKLKITETEGSVVRVSLLTGSGPAGATGGDITTISDGSYKVHRFTSSGTFTAAGIPQVEVLVVGGGGGGGDATNATSGGGGGGSVEYATASSITAGAHTVTVGGGGANGAAGSNSSFNGIVAYGGGRGGSTTSGAATSGGSGGGGYTNQAGAVAGSGTNVHDGGRGDNGTHTWPGGGGGGAGGAGGGLATGSFNGGAGIASSITGSSAYYGGGGGGGTYSASFVTTGGSGVGGGSAGQTGSDGMANTGGGGGGAGADGNSGLSFAGGHGGSGVVVIRYATPNPNNFYWQLQEGNGDPGDENSAGWLRTTKHTSSVTVSEERDVLVEVRTGGASGEIVSKTKYHYETLEWGEEVTKVLAYPTVSTDDTDALVTEYKYYETVPTTGDAHRGNYRKLRATIEPNGNWTAYEYYDSYAKRGQLYRKYNPDLENIPSTLPTTLDADVGRVVTLDYTYNWSGRYRDFHTRTEKINGVQTAYTIRDPDYDSATTLARERYEEQVHADGSNTKFMLTHVEYYRSDAGDPDLVGQPCLLITPNVAQTSAIASRGDYNVSTKEFTVNPSGSLWREATLHGSYTSDGGATAVTAFAGQSCDSIWMLPYKSTVDVVIRLGSGAVYRKESWVYTGGTGFSRLSYEDYDYDTYGHVIQISASNGAISTFEYTDGQLTKTVDASGIDTRFTYDLLGRSKTSRKVDSASDITTIYTYDGANRITAVVSESSGTTPLTLATSSSYDCAGRITSSVAPGGYTKLFDYSEGPGIVTITNPDSGFQKTESNLDGSVLRVTGNATVEQHISYSVDDPSGNITQQVISGSSTSSVIMRTTRDWAQRMLSVEKPGWSGPITRNFIHDNYGHLVKESQSGSSLADKHYAYDTMGFLKWEGIRLSGSGALDNLSKDRITNYTWEYFSTGTGVWWRRDATSTYATDDSSTTTPLSKIETQISGFSAAGSGYTRLSRTDSHDVFGNVTTSYAEVNRSAKTVVQTTVAPDATTSVKTSTNGLLVSAKGFTGHTTTFGYDHLGRMITSLDPRSGTTTTAYMTGTSQVHTLTDGNSKVQATYAYDDAGRVKSIKDARDYYTRYEYTKRGELQHQWGTATYPVAYAYDSWGRRTGMTTYASSTTTFGETWPSGTGLPDNPKTTVWHYDEDSGLLVYKEDAAGKRVNYTYTDLGQVKTREWARFKAGSTTEHVKATYHYFGEQSGELKTGELRLVDYNDTITPDVSYTYNRLGRIVTVADAVSGTRTFNYALGGTLELQSEVLPAYFNSRHISYGYDTATGKKGRPNSLKLGSSSSTASDQDIVYGYDSVGRLDSVAAGGQTFTYTYETHADLIKQIQNSDLTFKDVRTYDPKHDWVDDRETSWGSTPTIKAKFAYAQNDVGHVTDVTKTGELFDRYYHVSTNTGLKTSYAYNGRGELTAETSADLHTTPNPIAGRQDTDYSYDALGNRLSHTHNGQTIAYTPDDLNRYTQRDVLGSFDVAGRAPGSTVTVTPSSGGTAYTAARNGKYFFQAFPLANTAGAVFSQLEIADNTSPTPNTSSVNAYVSKDDEVFGYDDDGNLTSDGRWIYAYDAENRLIAMETDAASAPTGLTRQKLAFAYDYLGRRISKTVQNWTGSAYAAAHVSLRYVYNGWNLMAELDHLAGDAVVRSYYWGLDLSGSEQGAGGVGGLLMVQGSFFNSETALTDTAKTLVALYDAMGNLHGMLNTASVSGADGSTYGAGSLVSAFEYDAFGKTLRESGPYAGSNPFRYSTKYTDIETGLVYYGLRYYSPSLGRFITKDPIEEQGGINLYNFVRNNPINKWDYIGLVEVPDWWEGSEQDYLDYMNPPRDYGSDGSLNWFMRDYENPLSIESADAFRAQGRVYADYLDQAYFARQAAIQSIINQSNAGFAAAAAYIEAVSVISQTEGPSSGASREKVVDPTGEDYFGAALPGSISNGTVTFIVNYSAAFAKTGQPVSYFFEKSAPMGGGGLTTISAEVSKANGRLNVAFHIGLYFSSTTYGKDVPLYTQYAEYQHLRDYTASIQQMFPIIADGFVRGKGLSVEAAYNLFQVRSRLETAGFETVAKYDSPDSAGNPGQHDLKGQVLRPSDFKGIPAGWWR